MKIEQNPEFQPIVITLETKEEARALWEIMVHYTKNSPDYNNMMFAVRVCDWFILESEL